MAPRRRRGATDSIPTGRNRSSSSCTSSATTGDRLRRGPPIIDGTLRGPEAVFALLLSYARQIGLNAADKVLFIADGAPWIWQRIPRLIAALGLSPTQVLGLIDFYHAAKQLSDAVKLRRWSATQRTRWLNRTRGLLKRARVDEVITALRELCRGRTAGKIRTHLNYFLKNRHRFAYTTMAGLGLPRGSGAVESAIRRVINLRIKGASIYWLPESVDAILLLRSFYKSGRWNCLPADGHDAGGCERVTGKSGMRPRPEHVEVVAGEPREIVNEDSLEEPLFGSLTQSSQLRTIEGGAGLGVISVDVLLGDDEAALGRSTGARGDLILDALLALVLGAVPGIDLMHPLILQAIRSRQRPLDTPAVP